MEIVGGSGLQRDLRAYGGEQEDTFFESRMAEKMELGKQSRNDGPGEERVTR